MDEQKEDRRPDTPGYWAKALLKRHDPRRMLNVFGVALGVLALVVVLWLIALWHATLPPSGNPPKRLVEFTSRETDPGAYWGRYSAAIEVRHDRFDKIIFNRVPDSMNGFVLVGMREGKVLSYYACADWDKWLSINDKAFPWSYKGFSKPQRPPEQLKAVTQALTEREINDLDALGNLLKDHQREMAERMDAFISSDVRIVREDIQTIVEAKRTHSDSH